MKIMTLLAAVLLSMASVAVTNASENSDNVTVKTALNAGGYCHIKFPAIDEKTLYTNDPVLKNASSGDIIDFYGPCDENPTGPDQVQAQAQDLQIELERGYSD